MNVLYYLLNFKWHQERIFQDYVVFVGVVLEKSHKDINSLIYVDRANRKFGSWISTGQKE